MKEHDVLLIDNCGSFTYNLVQYLLECKARVNVQLNNHITAKKAESLNPSALVFSPGPGNVKNTAAVGNGPGIFKVFRGRVPILGVCLGHQMLAHMLGARIVYVEPAHGVRSAILLNTEKTLFRGLSEEILGARYHSMVVEWSVMPKGISVTACTIDENKHIMAFEHKEDCVYGIQFHPESIGTSKEVSIRILKNFLAQ